MQTTTLADTENEPNNTIVSDDSSPRDGVVDSTKNNTTVDGVKKKKKKGGISFGEVRVREHERVLNHRPSARYADLALGWGYQKSERLLVDDFEKIKEEEHHREKKKHKDHERLQVLCKYGYSPKDVLALEKDKKKALERREKGIANPPEEDEDNANINSSPKLRLRGFKKLFSGVGLKRKVSV